MSGGLVGRHCEERSDEAIQLYGAEEKLDCFAALAMTRRRRPRSRIQEAAPHA
jgi:hypothetical protein